MPNSTKKEILQREIDWIKFSMETDKHAHAGEYNALLQNVAIKLVLFIGVLASVNLLVVTYLHFLDGIHFVLLNICLILLFFIHIRDYEQRTKDKPGGINNIEKEFKMKKCLIRKRYNNLGADLDKIQKEFRECPFN